MVTTRLQSNRDNRIELTEINIYSNDDDNASIAHLYSRNYFQENNEEAMRSQERDHERRRIEQRLSDMNRQLGELTSIVRALIEKISNGREENGQNVRCIQTSLCSDTKRH